MTEQIDNLVHMHCHSDASIIDGLGTNENLVKTAANLGFTALGLTDHGTLTNTIVHTQACKRYGIKPILGLEAYVGRDGKRFHLTLLADGNEGFNTLVELNNFGQLSGDKMRPTIDLSLLRKHNKGLIVLTGCPASPFQELDYADSLEIGREMKDFLGKNLFAEVMFIGSQPTWERSAKLARDLQLAPILTNDCHFPLSENAQAHVNLVSIKSHFNYDSRLLFLATPDQMRARVAGLAPSELPLLEKSMMNSAKLAGKIQAVTFNPTPRLPFIPKADDELTYKAMAKLTDIFGYSLAPTNYVERMQEELGVITAMGFSTYFLILQDIIQFARRNNIRVGEGRGSAVGSLVCYLLGITGIDPIVYGLSFDRFLNRKRKEMPDIDTDIEDERRQEVLKYAHEKWGAIQIATLSTYSHKVLTNDLGKFFKVDRELIETASDGGKDSEAFLKIATTTPQFADTYNAMENQIRHVGMHAGGVIIVDETTKVP